MTTSETIYALDNAWADAHRRLSMLEACYDPGTKRRLDAIGVASGWRCLEVGGGAGSVTRWLCDRVGRYGQVVAVDLDPRFLAQIDAANLSVCRLDVTREDLRSATSSTAKPGSSSTSSARLSPVPGAGSPTTPPWPSGAGLPDDR